MRRRWATPWSAGTSARKGGKWAIPPPPSIWQRLVAANHRGVQPAGTLRHLDLDRATGTIRDVAHAFSRDGGLAVCYGNIAVDGAIVKTAGVDPDLLVFSGSARIFESQDDAVSAILGDKVKPGDVVVIRYEGPKGGPGMQEMLYPTSYLKSKGLAKSCALITDGRFSGGSSGLSLSPRLSGGGGRRRDRAAGRRRHYRNRHPGARLSLVLSDEELAARRTVCRRAA